MTFRCGRTHNKDQWTYGENNLDEGERGEDKTPETRIPEVKYHCQIWKDMRQRLVDFWRKHSG